MVPSLSTMEEYFPWPKTRLDPVECNEAEEFAPPLDLKGFTVESLFTSDHDKITLKHIREQVAKHVEAPHKVTNFVNAMVDADLATQFCGDGLDCEDPAELKKVQDEDHITEGFEILDKVKALQDQSLLATRKTQLLALSAWNLSEKIKLLESSVNLPVKRRPLETNDYSEEEQGAAVLSPLRSFYLEPLHDQAREEIAEKLSATALHARHQKFLRLRVSMNLRWGDERMLQHNLWRLMLESHAACPKSFSAATMWNQFVDEYGEENLVKLLGLSPRAILIARFGEGLGTQSPPSTGADAVSALRNKHVFAELVTRQDEDQRPAYSELYRFIFDSDPNAMNFEAICSPGQEKQGERITV